MADRPNIDISHLQKTEKVLGDIVQKFDTLARYDQIKAFELLKDGADEIENVDRKLDRMVQTLSSLNKDAGKHLSTYTDKLKDLNRQKRSLQQHMQWMTGPGGYKKESEQVKELEDRISKLNDEFEDLRKNQEIWSKIAARQGARFLDWFGGSAATLSLTSVTTGLKLLVDAIHKVYDLQEKWTAAIGNFRRSIGPATQGSALFEKEAARLQGTMMGLGMSFEQSFEEMTKFIDSYGWANEESVKLADTTWKFGLALGAGTETMGKFLRSFNVMGGNMKNMREYFTRFVAGANAAGVSTKKFTQELEGAIDDMVRFGPEGQKAFMDAASYVQHLGVSVKSLQNVMHLTDTFGSTAEAAAKLNTVFGTTINAMDLMLEEDPGKRFEMIRQQMLGAGKDMANLAPREIELISKTLNMSKEDVAAMTKRGKTYKEFMDMKSKKDAEAAKATENMNKIINKATTTMLNWGQIGMKVIKMLIPFVDAFLKPFGIQLGGADKGLNKLGDTIVNLAKDITSAMEPVKPVLTAFAQELKNIFKNMAGNNGEGIKSFVSGLTNMFTMTLKVFMKLGSFFEGTGGKVFLSIISGLMSAAPVIGAVWGATKLGGMAGKAMSMFGGGKNDGSSKDKGLWVRMSDAAGKGDAGAISRGFKDLKNAFKGGQMASTLGGGKGGLGAGLGGVKAMLGSSVSKMFAGGVMKGLGKSALKMVPGLGLAMAAKDLYDAFTGPSENRGSQIGGALGSLVGGFVPIPGIGPLLGNLVGGAIGGMFDKPSAEADSSRDGGGAIAPGKVYTWKERGSNSEKIMSTGGGFVTNKNTMMPVTVNLNVTLDGKTIQRIPFTINLPANPSSPGFSGVGRT